VDLARLQRAPEGADQSSPGGGNDVIKRRRVWFRNFGAHTIVFGNSPMHTESNGLGFSRQISQTQRATFAYYANMRNVGNILHGFTFYTSDQFSS